MSFKIGDQRSMPMVKEYFRIDLAVKRSDAIGGAYRSGFP
jgi:hypothetical protein